MKFLHIFPGSKDTIADLNKEIETHGKHVFLLVYLEGCGPCNATRPEWKKLKNVMKSNKNSNIVVADLNQELASKLKPEQMITSFPTILYLAENGNKKEMYEDSSIHLKDRTIDSFVQWIQSKNIPLSLSLSLKGGNKTRRTKTRRTKTRRTKTRRTKTRRTKTRRTKTRKSN
jgi:thiol-disulfide isomerase/thioredoxin